MAMNVSSLLRPNGPVGSAPIPAQRRGPEVPVLGCGWMFWLPGDRMREFYRGQLYVAVVSSLLAPIYWWLLTRAFSLE